MLVAAWLVGGATAAHAQPAIGEFEVESYPLSHIVATLDGGPAASARATVVRGNVVVPLLLGGDRTRFVPTLSVSRVGISVRPLDDPQAAEPLKELYDLDLNLVLLRELTERWQLAVVASPGIATDFRNIDIDHATFQGAVVATRTQRPGLAWGIGGSVTNAFGELLALPVASLEWAGDLVRADVLAPARAAVFWTPGTRVEVGVTASVDGNVYRLGRNGDLHGAVVRYSVVDVGPVARVKLAPSVRVSVAGSASLRRRLEIEARSGDRLQDATLRRGVSLRVGLAVLAPPGGADRR